MKPESKRASRVVEPAGRAGSVVAFVNVNIVPMDSERLLGNFSVLVHNDRIFAVGPAEEVELPANATIIDGGGYLMPGLADMHVHLWERDPDPQHLVLYLAQGVTTVRAFSGPKENALWREQVVAGELQGPTILTAGNLIIDGIDDFDPEFVATQPVFVPATPAEAAAEARRQAESWPDFIKVYDGLSPESYLAAIAAARDAGSYVAGHALDALSLEAVMTSGINEIAHLDELNFYHWKGFPDQDDFAMDYGTIPGTAALMAANAVAIVSNLSADEVVYQLIFDTDSVLSRPEYTVARPEMLAFWRRQGRQHRQFAGQGSYRKDREMPFFMALVRGLQDAGVPVTIGTDTSYLVEGSVPSQIHRELELLVEAGFSPYEALAAGTRNAGLVVERMRRDGRFGTVAAGQRADLLLLAANPLENVSHTRNRVGVMARGRWYPQSLLDAQVTDFIATY